MIYRNLFAEELVSGLNGPEREALQLGSQAVDMPPAQACVVLDGTVG